MRNCAKYRPLLLLAFALFWGLVGQTAVVRAQSGVFTVSGVPIDVTGNSAVEARETEILQWIAAGKSQQDIADILTISHRTVEVHLRSARTKLNALTTAQAIGRAIGLGLIYPE